MNWVRSDFISGQDDTLGMPPTPLESAQFRRFSGSSEINAYLHALAAKTDLAQAETWGYSVDGQALTALKYSDPQLHAQDSERLRVVIVGSQHGASEAAGGEALLVFARQLLQPRMLSLLQVMDIFLLPNANPDGRDRGSSKNANGKNLNRDYVLLSQPESRALDAALARIRPHVVLDAHESAALKRKTLGREGYVTEFEFVNHGHMRLHAPILRPECYYISEHVALFEQLLSRHSLAIERISRTELVRATALQFTATGEGFNEDIEVQERPIELQLQTGWLCVSLNQPRGLLLPQLLEPQSDSSYFRHERFHAMCQADRPFFIYRGQRSF